MAQGLSHSLLCQEASSSWGWGGKEEKGLAVSVSSNHILWSKPSAVQQVCQPGHCFSGASDNPQLMITSLQGLLVPRVEDVAVLRGCVGLLTQEKR